MERPCPRLCWRVMWLFTAVITLTDGGKPGEYQDYCERESFTAQCPSHQVILIRIARYGRIRKSRCITDNYPIDCSTSAQPYLDAACSGRRQCDVNVVSLVPKSRLPCGRDLKSYLDAIYDCIPVAHADASFCKPKSGGQLQLTAPLGYLSTLEANQTGCGTVDTPWLIVAKSGQVIRITLLDFSAGADIWTPRDGKVCRVIAVIRDVHVHDTTETVCGNGAREEDVFTSISNMVEVRLVGGKMDGRYPLIRYEMLGCADMAAPPGGWMRRVDNIVTMGCNDSDGSATMWTMKCEGNEWISVGRRRNCTTAVAVTGRSKSGGVWHLFTNSHSMSIVTVLVIALIVGLIILAIGLVYLRRCRTVQHQAAPPLPEEDYRDVTKDGGRDVKQSDTDSLQTYQTTGNAYYRTWQMQPRRHLSCQSAGTASMPPPPYCGTPSKSPYVEHIYESPKFDRRDVAPPYGGSQQQPVGDLITTEYYELDPESVNVSNMDGRGK